MNTFKERSIDVIFKMGAATFENEADTIEIKGLRVIARITTSNLSYNIAQIMIYGVSQDVMNRLLTLRSMPIANIAEKNTVTLCYPDKTNTTIFSGAIVTAIADYSSAPNVPFVIEASSTYMAQMKMPQGLPNEGTVKVSTIMEKLARLSGKNLINNGIDNTYTLTDHSLQGSLQEMMDDVSQAAGIECYTYLNTVVIFPKGSGRDDLEPITLSSETGLIGWPTPTDYGCTLRAMYSPDYIAGRKINIVCPDIPYVNGTMSIIYMVDEIDSQLPGGKWFTHLKLQRFLA